MDHHFWSTLRAKKWTNKRSDLVDWRSKHNSNTTILTSNSYSSVFNCLRPTLIQNGAQIGGTTFKKLSDAYSCEARKMLGRCLTTPMRIFRFSTFAIFLHWRARWHRFRRQKMADASKLCDAHSIETPPRSGRCLFTTTAIDNRRVGV